MTPARLSDVNAAGAPGTPTLFLNGRLGALTMVQQLYAAGGGAESEADAFARHVEADQQIEIARMRELLAR